MNIKCIQDRFAFVRRQVHDQSMMSGIQGNIPIKDSLKYDHLQTLEIGNGLPTKSSQALYLHPITKMGIVNEAFWELLIQYIRQTLSDLNIETLAGHFHMSRSTLHRKIKTLTGQFPVDFLRIV